MSSLNVTVPVGVPAPGDVTVTVAVIVTDCPTTDGFGETETVLEVLAGFTVCERAPEVLVVKLLSPPYTAVMECDPTDNVLVAKVA